MFFHLRNTTELLELIWEVSRNLIPIWWCKSCGTCAFTWKLTVVWAVTFSQRVHASSYLPLGMSGLLFCLSIILHLFPPFFLYHLLFCLFCILKPFRGFFMPFRNIFQLKWWNYSKLRLYHISACIFAKTLSEDFLLRPCVFILPLLIPHTNVPLH